jgi:hypothetical protein
VVPVAIVTTTEWVLVAVVPVAIVAVSAWVMVARALLSVTAPRVDHGNAQLVLLFSKPADAIERPSHEGTLEALEVESVARSADGAAATDISLVVTVDEAGRVDVAADRPWRPRGDEA